jgi:hypothetical protein
MWLNLAIWPKTVPSPFTPYMLQQLLTLKSMSKQFDGKKKDLKRTFHHRFQVNYTIFFKNFAIFKQNNSSTFDLGR